MFKYELFYNKSSMKSVKSKVSIIYGYAKPCDDPPFINYHVRIIFLVYLKEVLMRSIELNSDEASSNLNITEFLAFSTKNQTEW